MSKTKRTKYSGVSIPAGILKEIDELISELGYWPSRGAFVREACLEKVRRERQTLKELEATNHAAKNRVGGS